LDELFWKNIPDSKFNPNACQKPILINPKIVGISQFHNHIVGNVINKAIKITNPITAKILTKNSIIFQIKVYIILDAISF